MTHPSQANYLLIDGALRPDALVGLYLRHELFEINPLYLDTRWAELHDLGPILVKPHPDSGLLSEWLVDESLRKDSTLIYSEAPIQQVAEHLGRFVYPPDCRGVSGLLRFADPVVAHFWLSSFPPGCDLHLGPVQHWWVGSPRQVWESQPLPLWQTFSRSDGPSSWSDEPHVLLGEEQLAALDKAQSWRYTARVHTWLGEQNPQFFAAMSGSQISGWLHSSLQAGLAWGLFTERGLVIWIENCAEDGDDFATRPQGRYQNWLKLDPANARLSPESRIEAFDAHRSAQKDVAHD